MGEIYRDATNVGIAFDISGITPTSAIIRRGDIEHNATILTGAAKVPYSITRYNGKFEIEWTYTIDSVVYTKSETHEVITPYFSRASLIAWDADFNMLDELAVTRLEKIIRTVIENATGQKFQLEETSIAFRGNDAQFISLPKRLVKATRLNDTTGELLDSWISAGNDGWTLRISRQITWVDNMGYSGPPIQNPYKAIGLFKSGNTYVLDGIFGYDTVPEDILLAAKILAEDYGCDESLWRDRYIDNIRAADWRFEFHGKAFQGTGNVKVDQLLQKYTLSRMVIL